MVITDVEYANQVDCVQNENSPTASTELNGKAVQKVQRLIGYARVSTTDQNLDLQRDALKAAGCVKIFADTGVSGSLASRPQLDRMLKELRTGDCLIVWKLDRLGRSVRHLIILLDDLRARGVTFRSLTQDIDTSTALGRAMMHIMGVMAELERENIVERVNAGLAAARKRGVRIGRPRTLNSEQVAHARKLLETEGGRAVARSFGISRTTLYASLRR